MFQHSFLDRIASIYQIFIKLGNNLQTLFLLYMRVTWGLQFFISGLHKLESIEHVSRFFDSLAIPSPTFSAYLVAVIEAVCGFMLFVGFGSRLAAVPLIIVMITALSTAHGANLSDLKFLFHPIALVKEAPYPFLITALLVFVFGPGRISIDAWMKRWFDKQDQ
jgi:putative oxidoreductase